MHAIGQMNTTVIVAFLKCDDWYLIIVHLKLCVSPSHSDNTHAENGLLLPNVDQDSKIPDACLTRLSLFSTLCIRLIFMCEYKFNVERERAITQG